MQNLATPEPRLPAAAATGRGLFVESVNADSRGSADVLFSQLATALRRRDATIVALFVYGDVAARQETAKVMRRHLGAMDWPVLWVEGRSCNGALVAGVQAFAVSGLEVERVLVKGRVVGTAFSDGLGRQCLLAGIGPDDPQLSCAEQTEQTFANLQGALAEAGFDLADLARTWFYNDKLLAWYDVFNRVRTAYYGQRPFRSGSVPASTGVDGKNARGAALALAAWAVQPLNGAGRVVEVPSPLQCAALQYGSSFSRAVEISAPAGRTLLVSGTASIAPGGESIWRGNIVKQIATTMDVVGGILTSRGMRWQDVTRATAYFKYPLDAAAFETWQQHHHIALKAVYVHCDICRDDLLFELELDACQ